MKKIMLIDPGKVSESWYTVREMPSLALGCIGTYLKLVGHEVKIIDMATYKIDNERLKNEVAKFKPHIVGITSATFNIYSAYEAAQAVKQMDKNIFVVLGGAHATALPELTLKECPSIDTVVVGEGEIAMEKLCNNPRKGIMKEALIQNLDDLPRVDWTMFNYSKYKKLYSIRFNKELHKYTISMVRGCPFQCRFCFKLFPDPARSRTPEHVFSEIVYNYENLGARLFYLADSTALVYKKNIQKLCQLIINSGIDIALIVQSRADTVDRKSVELLKQAGCETFFIGVESGNDEMLKRIGKNITKDKVRNAVKIVHEVGISRIRCSFIIGLEGDTRKTIRETIDFAKELKNSGLNRASVHCLDIYPKTEYWNMVERSEGNLKLKSELHDWSVLSRLNPMTSCGDITIEELKKLRDEGKEPFQEEY